MGKKIKILYQFATAKLKTPNGNKEVLKRKKFLEKNIGTNTTIKLSIPNKGPGTIESDFDELKTTDLVSAKWFGRTLGLPKKYVEGVFDMVNIDPKKIGNLLTNDEIKKIFST